MIWCWRSDGHGDAAWEVYDETDAARLEEAYQSNRNGGDGTVVLQKGWTTYVCDVDAMQQTNLDSGFPRKIHRGWPQVPTLTANLEEGDEEEEEEEDEEEEQEEEYSKEESEEEELDEARRNEMKELFESSDPTEMTAAAPTSFLCPLSAEIMEDPVLTESGSTYERKMIAEWFKTNRTDPLTKKRLRRKQLIPNRALRDSIQEWRKIFTEEQSKQRQKGREEEEEEDSKPPARTPPILESPTCTNVAAAPATPTVNATAVSMMVGATTTAATTASNDLREGEERIVQGRSTGTSYTIKLLHGIYSCSCPAWRFAGGPIDNRSCKHLRQIRGEEAERRRLSFGKATNINNTANPTNTNDNNARKRKQPEPNSLSGQTICFTGALRTMTRREAQTLAKQCGASVAQSVSRNTTVLVVGNRPGVKLSNSDASPSCDTWTEEEFIAATTGDETVSRLVTTVNNTDSSISLGYRVGSAMNSAAIATSNDDNGTIPPRIMLAKKFEDDKDDPTGWLMSEKLDGMRAFWDGYAGKMWSRQGKAIHAPDWWTRTLPRGMYLDGELWLGRGQFQQCMSIVRRQDRPQAWDQITFLIFDAPDDVDEDGAPNTNTKGYGARHLLAEQGVARAKLSVAAGTKSYAKIHPYEICRDSGHLQAKLSEVEAANGEGLMLRRPDSNYQGGRSSDLLKVKSAHDDDAVVMGHDAGRGRHSGRVGALQVVNRSGKNFKVGSGLTDHERENPPAIGSVITYRYNELTNSGIPRFPIFVRVRPDVEASDVRNNS